MSVGKRVRARQRIRARQRDRKRVKGWLRNEKSGMEKEPVCSNLVSDGLCFCTEPRHLGSRDVIELAVKLKSPPHVLTGKKKPTSKPEDSARQE